MSGFDIAREIAVENARQLELLGTRRGTWPDECEIPKFLLAKWHGYCPVVVPDLTRMRHEA